MTRARRRGPLWAGLALWLGAATGAAPGGPAAHEMPAPQGRIAVTFDDLPVVSTRRDLDHWRDVTRRLLRTIRAHRVPAVGFVNENKLVTADTVEAARVAVLRQWTDAGLELGNHTYSHPSLHSTDLEAYEQDVIRGEPVTRGLLEEKGARLRYFRHPFLHTGRSLETRQEFEAFLHARGYTVAPVTIDHADWIFARAYDRARDAGDHAAMRRVTEAYLPYMRSAIEFWERQSVAILGREIPQVLLLHANALNADRLDALLKMLEGRGYRFIPLEEALRDSAYRSEDRFTGAGGISWIHRWGLTRQVPKETYRGEPEPPEDIVRMSEGRSGE